MAGHDIVIVMPDSVGLSYDDDRILTIEDFVAMREHASRS